MKKLVAVIVVMAGVLVGAPWVIGNVAEERLDRALAALTQAAPYLSIVEKNYTHGWFRSEQDVTFEVFGGATRPLGLPARFTVRNEILHGPVLGLAGLGLARVNTRLQLDAKTRAQLAQTFGTEEPLLVSTRIHFFGGGTTTFAVDANTLHPAGGGEVSWEDLVVDVHYSRNFDAFEIEGDWPRFEARDERKHSHLLIENVEIDGTSERVQGHLFDTDLDLSVEQLSFAEAGTPATSVSKLRYVVDTSRAGEFTAIATRFGSGPVTGGLVETKGVAITAMHYDFTARRLHTQTLARFSDSVAQGDPAAARALPDLVLELCRHDPELVIDRFGFESKDGAAYLKGVIRLEGVTEKDLRMGALSLLPRIDADLRFAADQVMLEKIDGAAEAVAGAIAAGYAERQGSQLVSRVEFHDGELQINGNIQDIPGLGAASPEEAPGPE